MKKRELYRLEVIKDDPDGDYIGVFRTDNNLGLLGYVNKDGSVNQHYYHSSIPMPKYIVKEALKMMKR